MQVRDALPGDTKRNAACVGRRIRAGCKCTVMIHDIVTEVVKSYIKGTVKRL